MSVYVSLSAYPCMYPYSPRAVCFLAASISSYLSTYCYTVTQTSVVSAYASSHWLTTESRNPASQAKSLLGTADAKTRNPSTSGGECKANGLSPPDQSEIDKNRDFQLVRRRIRTTRLPFGAMLRFPYYRNHYWSPCVSFYALRQGLPSNALDYQSPHASLKALQWGLYFHLHHALRQDSPEHPGS